MVDYKNVVASLRARRSELEAELAKVSAALEAFDVAGVGRGLELRRRPDRSKNQPSHDERDARRERALQVFAESEGPLTTTDVARLVLGKNTPRLRDVARHLIKGLEDADLVVRVEEGVARKMKRGRAKVVAWIAAPHRAGPKKQKGGE